MSDLPDLFAFFRSQAEAGPHIQFVYDVTTAQVVFINAAYQTVLGGNPAEVNAELPALLARLHPDDHRFLAHYWRLWVRGLMPDEIEIRLLRPDQPDQWFCLTPYHQHLPGAGVLLGATLRDISAGKHYQQNSDLFNSRKNAVLEILSHDLSGAFQLVQQLVQYLREEVAAPSGRVPEILQVLETTSRDNVRMIRDLVEVEFLASTNTDLKRSRVEVGAVLRPVLEELQKRQALLGMHFTYTLPAEPLYAELDINKLTQVLSNLLGNALKFTPDGGEVLVEVEPRLSSFCVHVRDTGIGIPKHLLPHLFERFTKARRPGLRGEETTGLGLILCKTIVEWHGGTIGVQSIEGRGSVFTVELPLAAG